MAAEDPETAAEALREELAPQQLPAEWKMLAMHYRRDALFVVGGELALLDVAVAVASDDAGALEGWLARELIARPSPEQVERWGAEEGAQFVCVIVQPFVLAQRVDDFVAGG